MAEEILLTQEGYDKLEEERDYLVAVRRKEVSERLKEAISYGDLSENAEYDAAKDEQRDIEARIEELEKLLKNVEVVGQDEVDADTVGIGSRVKLYDVEMDEEVEYTIVGSTEADALNGKISNESPVGAALIGSKVGETIVVETISGDLEFKILEIARA